MAFCSNCGERLVDGARFCHACGTSAAGTEPNNNSQRKQEYVGKILKCPNCGSVITETTVICPDCGIRITGRTAVSSVQAFKEQLMSIESTRKKSKFMDVYTQSANPTDTQKLALKGLRKVLAEAKISEECNRKFENMKNQKEIFLDLGIVKKTISKN